MDWMPGGDWGFKEQVEKWNIAVPTNLALDADHVRYRCQVVDQEENREKLRSIAVEGHRSYWDDRSPGVKYEHWRFAQGVS